jgi:hypothetical protein
MLFLPLSRSGHMCRSAARNSGNLTFELTQHAENPVARLLKCNGSRVFISWCDISEVGALVFRNNFADSSALENSVQGPVS